jgi:ABC-type Na+ efflux pump permease subunit
MLTSFGLLSLGVVFALASASLLASTLVRQTRDAVLGLYCVLAVATTAWFAMLQAWPESSALGEWLRCLDPVFVLQPSWEEYSGSGKLTRRLALALATWGAIGTGCVLLATALLRPVYMRQLQGGSRRERRFWWQAKRSLISSDPIHWKEREVEGIAPIALLRLFPAWLGVALVIALTTVCCLAIVVFTLPPTVTFTDLRTALFSLDLAKLAGLMADTSNAESGFLYLNLFAVLFFSLLVGVRASGTICGERERQTWEALLLTPLETRSLIRSKLAGILAAARPYLLAYAIPAVCLSILGGLWAFLSTWLWLAATWLAMYYIGAAGIWCSVRSKGSWRALLGTLAFGYLCGAILYAFSLFPTLFITIMLLVAVGIVQTVLNISLSGVQASTWDMFFNAFAAASGLCLAGMFWGTALLFLGAAEKYVGDLERTRHWKDQGSPIRLHRPHMSRPRLRTPNG